MDGFDVRNMVADQIRDVDGPTANYLVIAGYAVRIRANDDYPHDRNRRVSRDQRDQWDSNPPPEQDFRDASHRDRHRIPPMPDKNGRAPLGAELSGPRLGARQEQSRPKESTNNRQITEPMEE
jgi:hypothetical protein